MDLLSPKKFKKAKTSLKIKMVRPCSEDMCQKGCKLSMHTVQSKKQKFFPYIFFLLKGHKEQTAANSQITCKKEDIATEHSPAEKTQNQEPSRIIRQPCPILERSKTYCRNSKLFSAVQPPWT